MSPLQVELVAADRRVWTGEASMVRARSMDGELGILPGHTPLLGVLVSGDVVIHGEGGDQTATIDSGFPSSWTVRSRNRAPWRQTSIGSTSAATNIT